MSLSDLINLDVSSSTDKIIAEYIWIGGSGMDLRSKARTLPGPVSDPSELPKWNYDGSSTNQAPGDDSEVIIYPQAIFKDPFRRGNNILVMCDSYTPQGAPIPTNKRHHAAKIFSQPDVVEEEPWYGIEQEYTLLQKDIKWPLGWPTGGYPAPQGPYYCGTGADKAFGRDIVDAHYKACLYAGINISGTNGEVMPGQRITEMAGVILSFDPKPVPGDWNGAGAHTNYSTKSMRADGGYEVIKKAIGKLEKKHIEHIAAYGEGNERRLTGKHETADIKNFKWGPYYCGTGADKAFGRDIVDAHYKACLYAGINISGTNGEVMPGQRITEMAGVILSFDPKPVPGDWNGAGAHTNYSTKSMRADGGYEVIKKAIGKLEKKHIEHIAAYGEGNERRLTGKHETADIKNFKWGVANRGASVRVGRETEREKKGYFEDRRPSSNMDPYVVTSMIAETTIIWKP
ncbi:glutamine synthetase 1,4 [Artemisia annua]|uniref:glutamine synthetase n=1 Tax=Artemisia annua TaxID=35608 RepID=A0A2U1QEB1_ARTAN|nr:glutamine synthetase 1,4 [Artemisia annua]